MGVREVKSFVVKVNGNSYEVEVEERRGGAAPAARTAAPVTAAAPKVAPAAPKKAPAATKKGTGTVKAPMPGTILSISVEEGDTVTRGQVLCMLEAMKMENEVRAIGDAVIQSVEVKVGDQLSAGQTMFILG